MRAFLFASICLGACVSPRATSLTPADAARPGEEPDLAPPLAPDLAAAPRPDAAPPGADVEPAAPDTAPSGAVPDAAPAPAPDAAPAAWPSYQSTTATGAVPGSIWDLAIAPDGSIYTAGIFKGTVDFDPGPRDEKITALALGDVFVTKSGPDGSYQWTRTVPSTGDEPWVTAIASTDGGVFLTGGFKGTADFFPGQPGAKKTSSMTQPEAFVLKLGADGTFGFLRTFPAGNSAVYDGAGLRDGGVVVAGGFYGPIDLGMGPRDMGVGGGFLVKLSATGTTVWGRTFLGQDLPMGGFTSPQVAVEAADGSIWTAGSFAGRLDLDPGAGTVETMAGAAQSLFVVKLGAAGQYLSGGAVMVGAKELVVRDLAAAADGSLFLAGHYAGPSFPRGLGSGAAPTPNAGSHDAFLAKVASDGKYQWGRSFGGSDYDYAWNLVAAPDGGVLATGLYLSPKIEIVPGEPREPAGGSLFLGRWTAAGEVTTAVTIGPKRSASPMVLRPAKDGFVLGGAFFSAVDFNPAADKDERTPIGQAAFASKYAF